MERLWAPWRHAYVEGTHDQDDDRCIFCRPEEDLVLRRTVGAFVLLNRFPYTSAHMMVAPVRHVGRYGDLTPAEAAEIHRLTIAALQALEAAYAPHGFNLGWNLGRVAGAGIIDHVHEHVVPRWGGDTNFMPILADTKVLPEALTESARRLRDAWPA